MVQETAPVRRRLVAQGKMARRKRIFARLREGATPAAEQPEGQNEAANWMSV